MKITKFINYTVQNCEISTIMKEIIIIIEMIIVIKRYNINYYYKYINYYKNYLQKLIIFNCHINKEKLLFLTCPIFD